MSVSAFAYGNFVQGISLDAGDGGSVGASDGVSPFDSNVGIRFLTTGIVQIGTSINGGVISWSDHGVWIDPVSAASGNYSVRYTNKGVGSDFTTKAALEDVFIAISATRTWVNNKIIMGSFFFTCDFEVRDDVGSIPTATVAYSFSIENGV